MKPFNNANAVCLECGTTKENPKNANCINGHDNWLEEEDDVERFEMAKERFGVDTLALLRSIRLNIDLKPIDKLDKLEEKEEQK